MSMYITDVTHFLDEKGAIEPKEGPALQISEFLGAAIISATLPASKRAPVHCFKCSHVVLVSMNSQDKVEWKCGGCGASGVISNWGGTLWDMTMNKDLRAD